jgi:uncharacterized protein YjbI with pentapeptide repeats
MLDLLFKNLRLIGWRRANLQNCDLSGANLQNCDLSGADLRNCDFRNAVLWNCDLRGANLQNCDLSGADLSGVIGNGRELVSIQVRPWPVSITKDVIQIGCQQHTHATWAAFTDEQISAMAEGALDYWRKYKQIILALATTCSG